MIASVQPSMDASSNSSARRRCCLGGGIGGGLLIAQAPGCSVCSSFRQVRNCSRHIGVVDQLEAAFTAGLAGRGVRSVFGICGEGLDCFRRWKLRSAIKVVSRGLPSSVFTFPLRDRYLPPCLCTMSCTEAAYAGTHPSSVTLMSAIRYTVIVFISCSRSKKNPLGPDVTVLRALVKHSEVLTQDHKCGQIG